MSSYAQVTEWTFMGCCLVLCLSLWGTVEESLETLIQDSGLLIHHHAEKHHHEDLLRNPCVISLISFCGILTSEYFESFSRAFNM